MDKSQSNTHTRQTVKSWEITKNIFKTMKMLTVHTVLILLKYMNIYAEENIISKNRANNNMYF